jgi:hypothetical protein
VESPYTELDACRCRDAKSGTVRTRKKRGDLNTGLGDNYLEKHRRLAARYGVTKREMLERLMSEADQQIKDTLNTDEEWDTYFNVTQ